jgi:protein phosphatase inhibitor 2
MKFDRWKKSSKKKSVFCNGRILGEMSNDDEKPVKGILKNAKRQRTSVDDGERKAVDGIVWDEENLLINEANKCSTMKIDEPDTPYNFDYDPNECDDDESDHDDSILVADVVGHVESQPQVPESAAAAMKPPAEKVDPFQVLAAVEQALHASEDIRPTVVARQDDDDSDDANWDQDEPLGEEAEKKRQGFERRRKQHYNMGALLRRVDNDSDSD